MKVKVINPTENDISVSINGHEYFVEGKGFVEAEEEDAVYWKSKLHQFLVIEKAESKKEEVAKVVDKAPKKEEQEKEVKSKK